MQWSKLKKRVEALFSENIVGRVGLYSTRYGTDRDSSIGRAWITIDGVEVFNCLGDSAWHGKLLEREYDSDVFEPISPTYDDCKNANQYKERFNLHLNSDEYKNHEKKRNEIEQQLINDNIFHQSDLGMAMYDYPNLSIEEILNSEDIFIRALGMLDRRVGKRKLKSMKIEKEHLLIQKLYQFRIESEGINFATAT